MGVGFSLMGRYKPARGGKDPEPKEWLGRLELLEQLEAEDVELEEGDEDGEEIVRQRGAEFSGGPPIGYRR